MEAILTPPEALRLCRERAGLSQLDLIHKWRLRRPNQISRIENGHEIPNAKLAAKIEAEFAIPASEWHVAESSEAA